MVVSRKIGTFRKILVVEGYSDLLFLAEVLETLGLQNDVFIQQFNGKSNLLGQLEVFLTPEILTKDSIGVIVDADANAKQAATQIAAALKKSTTLDLQNGIWHSGPPKLGFLVLPGNDQPGEIETLAWQAVVNDPTCNQIRQCVETFLGCMSTAGKNSQSPDKAKISALLSILNDEDPRLGPGTRAQALSLARPEYDELKQFLAGL